MIVKQSEHYEANDIIVFQDKNMLVIHRIVQINNNTVVTKGDANNISDTAIEISKIKGKMIFRIPRLGWSVRLIQSHAGFITLLIAAIILFELPYYKNKKDKDIELQNIISEIEQLKEELQK